MYNRSLKSIPLFAGMHALVITCPKSFRALNPRSDYDSDEEEEDDSQPRKLVPDWARGRALVIQLLAQQGLDPDDVFQHHKKTLCLDDVFDKTSACSSLIVSHCLHHTHIHFLVAGHKSKECPSQSESWHRAA